MPSYAMAKLPTMPRLSFLAALALCAAILLVTAAVLAWMGHVLICKCGYIKLWHASRTDSETSQHLTDWYTYSHVLHGIILYWLTGLIAQGRLSVAARLVIATSIEAGWEIFENTPFIINRYRTVTISRDYFGDSIVNSLADITAMILGFLVAARLPAWVTVALLIGVELALLVLIRDNLTLNIIMLIHPTDWLRAWQGGG
ncbi:MAG TPA: DUF2585 family protein [Hyphomicrobiaceae bacterium]|nr:DUF2585 family protein [Hyphomicrobiaceae bacterium]